MEASVNTTVELFLKPPKLELLNQLLPCEPNKCHPHQRSVASVSCSSKQIPMWTNSHWLVAFLKTWFAILKGSKGEISWPDFTSAASTFPARNTTGVRAGVLTIKDSNIEQNRTTRRFLFDHKAMNKLKSMSTKKRIGETFSKGAMGNLVWPTLVVLEGVNKNTEIIDLVEILKEGLGKVTKDLFLKLQNDLGFLWSYE
ncbi:hypothetical protein V8G54_011793 [Vigna mungo]|uniref:Uncharacterized protein n=1 Tax=Vigna mungo TaxID=3915 RepID=A0AAQ3NSY5_VIGMU